VLARAEKIAYCPTCTAKNVAGAPVCSSCGVPLTSIAGPSSGPAATPRWGLMALIAAVTILISVLILAYASIAR
jgi:hypothetical protein